MSKESTRTKRTNQPAERGTAAGLRAGAQSRTEARALTSNTAGQSRKELTKRGGPGRAGTQGGQRGSKAVAAATRSKRTATRGRGDKARAGA
jgi:hypothetical protein